ncbi:MAG: nucleoside recognition protein [Lachnospiraceae bacterium]|nr:nucleoside recognition protein [Lachnospiraceae bacterium]
MLNYLWALMILIGVIYGSITGNMEAVGEAAIDSGKDAVSLCITMLGVVTMWTGIMKIAENCGIIAVASKKLSPFISFMFPKIPKDHKAREYITTNFIANIFGLGWAATPAGLKAMKELSRLEDERQADNGYMNKKRGIGIASNEMCTFLVINISSLQLIPINVIAYRSQYGSVNPAIIIGPAIVATLFSTIVGIIFCKIMSRK